MTGNCEHNTTVIEAYSSGVYIERCTSGCDAILVSVDKPDGVAITATVAELIAALEGSV